MKAIKHHFLKMAQILHQFHRNSLRARHGAIHIDFVEVNAPQNVVEPVQRCTARTNKFAWINAKACQRRCCTREGCVNRKEWFNQAMRLRNGEILHQGTTWLLFGLHGARLRGSVGGVMIFGYLDRAYPGSRSVIFLAARTDADKLQSGDTVGEYAVLFSRCHETLGWRVDSQLTESIGQNVHNCGKDVELWNRRLKPYPRSLTILVLLSVWQCWFVSALWSSDSLLPLKPLKPQCCSEAVENFHLNGFELTSFNS
jgi:hypothetical protein